MKENYVKRMKLMGLVVVSVLASSALAASSASALPEVGRCVAKAAGKYSDSNCTKVAKPSGSGSFEFVKGAAKVGFTASGGHSVLEGASGANVECESQTATGKLDADGSAGAVKGVESVVTTFTGCTLPAIGASCQNGATTGVIVTKSLEGNLGYLNKATKSAGIELHPVIVKKVSGVFAEFECGAGAVKVVTQSKQENNCIIAAIGPSNTMGPTSTETLNTLGGGKQEFTFFQPTPAKKCQLESSVNGGPLELSGQVLTATVTYEEPLEIKA
jgi:hypothetical protein